MRSTLNGGSTRTIEYSAVYFGRRRDRTHRLIAAASHGNEVHRQVAGEAVGRIEGHPRLVHEHFDPHQRIDFELLLDFEAGHEPGRDVDAAAERDHRASTAKRRGVRFDLAEDQRGIVGRAGRDLRAIAEDPLHALRDRLACVLRILCDGADRVAIGRNEILGVGTQVAGAGVGREVFHRRRRATGRTAGSAEARIRR